LWVRLSTTQTAQTYIYANNVIEANFLGEAQCGAGNVLGYWREEYAAE
jgi:hypothetical protein